MAQFNFIIFQLDNLVIYLLIFQTNVIYILNDDNLSSGLSEVWLDCCTFICITRVKGFS